MPLAAALTLNLRVAVKTNSRRGATLTQETASSLAAVDFRTRGGDGASLNSEMSVS
jgi:hypothetical protein